MSQRVLSWMLMVLVSITASSWLSAQAHLVRLEQATELATNPAAWKPHVGLYVVGGVPIRDDALAALGERIHREYPLWTVVLVARSEGHSFRETSGMKYGDEAVEFALGTTLFNSPGFKHPTNRETGLSERSVLAIVFDTRGAYAFTSPHHEHFGVSDEKLWQGISDAKLKPHFQASRFESGIIAAISALDEKLASAIWFAAWIWWIVLFVALAIAAVLLAVWLSSRSQKTAEAKQKAMALLGQWKESIGDRFAQTRKLDKERERVFKNPETGAKYGGHTQRLLDTVVEGVDRLFIIHGCFSTVLEDAERLLPINTLRARFDPTPYERIVALLKRDRIPFDPKHGLHVVVNGEQKSERELLWADISEYQPFEMTFEELVKLFGDHAKAADSALAEASRVIEQADDLVDRCQSSLDDLVSQFKLLESEMIGEATMAIPKFWGAFVPSMNEAIGSAVESLTTDPKAAFDAASWVIERLALAKSALTQLRGVVGDELSKAPAIRDSLMEREIEASWVMVEMGETARKADGLFGALSSGDEEVPQCTIEDDFNRLIAKCERCVGLADRLREGTAALTDVRSAVDACRSKLAASYVARGIEIPLSEVLQEGVDGSSHGVSVDALSEKARLALHMARAKINEGHLDDASTLIAASAESLDAVKDALVQASSVFDTFQIAYTAEVEKGIELDRGVVEVEEILSDIQREYAQSVLAFTADEPCHPSANGTVADNLEEIEISKQERNQALGRAMSAFESGRLFEARMNLQRASQANLCGQVRQEEIRSKQERLRIAVDSNQRRVEAIEAQLEAVIEACGRYYVQQSTLDARAGVRQDVTLLKDEMGIRLSDPFAHGRELTELEASCHALQVAIVNDEALFNEAKRSTEVARQRMIELERDLRVITSDSLADSEVIQTISRESRRLNGELRVAESQIVEGPHGDWVALDECVDRIAATAAALRQELKGEAKKGERALDARAAAVKAVKTARNWPGTPFENTHGVSIGASFGSDEFQRGDAALNEGRYDKARELFDAAKAEAESAVKAADKKVKQRIRDAEIAAERAADALRKSLSATRSSPSGTTRTGGGLGGSSPSFGGLSSGSRSSFSSPTRSGGTRSSW